MTELKLKVTVKSDWHDVAETEDQALCAHIFSMIAEHATNQPPKTAEELLREELEQKVTDQVEARESSDRERRMAQRALEAATKEIDAMRLQLQAPADTGLVDELRNDVAALAAENAELQKRIGIFEENSDITKDDFDRHKREHMEALKAENPDEPDVDSPTPDAEASQTNPNEDQ